MSAFQIELNDYPHFYLTEDGRLCSTGQHCLGFPRVLYNALIHLGYNGEVSMMIPFDHMEPWSGSIIGSQPDTNVEMMVHIALTSLCEDRLTATATPPIVLLPIQNKESTIWHQRLEVVSDLEGPHFHIGMTSLARYMQYLFNLHHNTARTSMQHHMRLTAYEEHTTATSREIERLRHVNAILCSGACPPSKLDRELQVTHRRVSEAEHGWNHTHQLLDITHDEVDVRTHGIIHLEHHIET
jgi:hypothetical protein